jgi:hypothetical protein
MSGFGAIVDVRRAMGREPFNECYRDISPINGFRKSQLRSGMAATDSSLRQIDSAGVPRANAPSVTGSGVRELRDAAGSVSSGPLVAPAVIALPGMVSYAKPVRVATILN